MPLDEIQQIFFRDLWNIYSQNDEAIDPVTFEGMEESYSLWLTNEPGCYQGKQEVGHPEIIGRYNRDLVGATYDVAVFREDLAIRESMIVELRTPGHQLFGKFWHVTGGPAVQLAGGEFPFGYAKVDIKHGVLRVPGVS